MNPESIEQNRAKAMFWIKVAAIKLGISTVLGLGFLLIPKATWPAFRWEIRIAANIFLALLSLAVLYIGWIPAVRAARSQGVDANWYDLFFPVIFGPGGPLVSLFGGLEYARGQWARNPESAKVSKPYGWAAIVFSGWLIYVPAFIILAAALG